MADNSKLPYDLQGPLASGSTLVPSDTQDVVNVTRALMVGASGNVSVVLYLDAEPVTLSLVAGAIYPLMVTRLMATGTTATGIVGLY